MAVSAPGAHLVVLDPPWASVDRAAARLAAALADAGVPIVARSLVEHDEAGLAGLLGAGGPLTVVVGGGDLARRALARATGLRLVLSERMLAALRAAAARRDRPLERRDERLALLPEGAEVWVAPGSEPGWGVRAEGRAFAVLPRAAAVDALLDHLLPFVQVHVAGHGAAVTRVLRVTGLSPAEVEERLGPGPAGVETAVLPAEAEVWVRLRARGATPAAARQALAAAEAAAAARLGEDCYGRDDDTLEQVVGRLLAERKLTLSVAESCTGGLLGHRVTNVPGSSAWFERGVTVYSNRAKQDLLGVPEAVLRAHGAVSAACAEAMARGIAGASGTPCALAITGIAGPEGGTPAKPVGTVFVGLAFAGAVASRRFRFAGDRAAVKWQSAQAALDLLRRRLLAEPAPA